MDNGRKQNYTMNMRLRAVHLTRIRQPKTSAHMHTRCVCICVCSEELAKITGESGHWHIKGRKQSLAYKRKKAVIGRESEERGIGEMIEKGE